MFKLIVIKSILFLLMADSDKRETVTPPVSLPDLFFLKKNGKGGNGFVAVNFAQLETSSCGSSATKTVATFNKDHLYYTPGFVLNCDRVLVVLLSPNVRKTHLFIWVCTTGN